MGVNKFSSVKESEVAAIGNKDHDNRFYFMTGALFITNLFRKGKFSMKNFTSPYAGICVRHFDIVLTCGHLDSGLRCESL
jgi:hypothetical protein